VQKSSTCRKLLLGDKGNCWHMMSMCLGGFVKPQLNRIL
jgi:hypothetical protein